MSNKMKPLWNDNSVKPNVGDFIVAVVDNHHYAGTYNNNYVNGINKEYLLCNSVIMDWQYVSNWISVYSESQESQISRLEKQLDMATVFIGACCQDSYDSYMRLVETGQVERNQITHESIMAQKKLEEINGVES
jgi:hypothetical protein